MPSFLARPPLQSLVKSGDRDPTRSLLKELFCEANISLRKQRCRPFLPRVFLTIFRNIASSGNSVAGLTVAQELDQSRSELGHQCCRCRRARAMALCLSQVRNESVCLSHMTAVQITL